jgi:hypothetical protein
VNLRGRRLGPTEKPWIIMQKPNNDLILLAKVCDLCSSYLLSCLSLSLSLISRLSSSSLVSCSLSFAHSFIHAHSHRPLSFLCSLSRTPHTHSLSLPLSLSLALPACSLRSSTLTVALTLSRERSSFGGVYHLFPLTVCYSSSTLLFSFLLPCSLDATWCVCVFFFLFFFFFCLLVVYPLCIVYLLVRSCSLWFLRDSAGFFVRVCFCFALRVVISPHAPGCIVSDQPNVRSLVSVVRWCTQ